MILNSENELIPSKKKFYNIFQLYFKNKILLLCVLVFTSKSLTAEESLPQPQNPDKEMNRRELLNQLMRVQIAGLPYTVIISLSE